MPALGGGLLAGNALLNLLGWVLPLLVALFTMPYIIRKLGTEEFGVLSIAWVLLNYFGILDMGLGRATTKFVADSLMRRETEKVPGLVWTSIGSQAAFGAVGTLLLLALTPYMTGGLLKIPASLVLQARNSFYILALSLPVLLVANSFRGVLEAVQRFDLVNYVKVPACVAIFLLPAIALSFGLRLPGIVLLIVLSRIGAALAYWLLCLVIFPPLRHAVKFESKMLRQLVTFGGWVMVSNVLSPILTYVDRFVIGSMLSLSAVAYYSAPYEAVTRLWIFPSSLVTTLFPAFSALDSGGAKERLGEVYARSVKALLLVLGPVTLLTALLAHDILRWWLGSEYAAKSAAVLQILSIGVLVNCVSFVPFSLIQAVGRPDLTAKCHLIEVPVLLGLMWLLIGRLGIVGAALAWTLRIALEAAFLFGLVGLLRLVSFRAVASNGLLNAVASLSAFAIALLSAGQPGAQPLWRLMLDAILLGLFLISAWIFALDAHDRRFLITSAGRVLSVLGLSR